MFSNLVVFEIGPRSYFNRLQDIKHFISLHCIVLYFVVLMLYLALHCNVCILFPDIRDLRWHHTFKLQE